MKGRVLLLNKPPGDANIFSIDAVSDPGTNVANIQNALDKGGTVVFAGAENYSINATLTIPSDTSVDFGGTIITPTSAMIDMNVIENANASDSNITIEGGVIEATATSVSAGTSYNVYMSSVTNCLIDGLISNGAANHGIYLEDSTDFQVVNCTANGNGDDGIAMTRCERGIVANNICKDQLSQEGSSYGVEVEDGCSHIIVSGNWVSGNYNDVHGSGGILVDTNAGQKVCNYITVVNNHVYDCQNSGIKFQNQKSITTGTATAGTAGTNLEDDTTLTFSVDMVGLYVSNTTDTTRTKITAFIDGNNVTVADAIFASGENFIVEDAYSTQMVCNGNTVRDAGLVPLDFAQCRHMTINENILEGNYTGGSIGLRINDCEHFTCSSNTISNTQNVAIKITDDKTKHYQICNNSIYDPNKDGTARAAIEVTLSTLTSIYATFSNNTIAHEYVTTATAKGIRAGTSNTTDHVTITGNTVFGTTAANAYIYNTSAPTQTLVAQNIGGDAADE